MQPRLHLANEDLLAVEANEVEIRCEFLWLHHAIAFIIGETGKDKGVARRLDLRRQDQSQFVIERDQSAIKSPVMKRIEAETVSRVKTIVGIGAPRNNMGGSQEPRVGQTSDAATILVGAQHSCSKQLLTSPRFGLDHYVLTSC